VLHIISCAVLLGSRELQQLLVGKLAGRVLLLSVGTQALSRDCTFGPRQGAAAGLGLLGCWLLVNKGLKLQQLLLVGLAGGVLAVVEQGAAAAKGRGCGAWKMTGTLLVATPVKCNSVWQSKSWAAGTCQLKMWTWNTLRSAVVSLHATWHSGIWPSVRRTRWSHAAL
jgi:hypothetical protein